jgi:hypothetical protein
MTIPKHDPYCEEIHDGETNDERFLRVQRTKIKRSYERAGLGHLVQVGGPDAPPGYTCPRSGYVLTRWDRIWQWLRGYR